MKMNWLRRRAVMQLYCYHCSKWGNNSGQFQISMGIKLKWWLNFYVMHDPGLVWCIPRTSSTHNNDVIMSEMASQITSLTIVYSTVCSCADQRQHQSSTSLAFVWGIHRWPVNSPHKGPVTRKIFPFDDVIMMSFSLEFDISVSQALS